MRHDLVRALQHGRIDPRRLNAIHRILLTTDETVTDMLEAYFQEPMEVVSAPAGDQHVPVADRIHA